MINCHEMNGVSVQNMPLLITRAIDGLNRQDGKRIVTTITGKSCQIMSDGYNGSKRVFFYKNYQASNNLTQEDLSRLDALQVVYGAEND